MLLINVINIYETDRANEIEKRNQLIPEVTINSVHSSAVQKAQSEVCVNIFLILSLMNQNFMF